MEKIFYTDKRAFSSSDETVEYLLRSFFDMSNVHLSRTENGKPYLIGNGLHFSVAHTNNYIFVVFSNKNVGLDVELSNRDVNYLPIVKKFSNVEQAELSSREEFIRHWLAKEAAVKWLGGTLAHDLYKLDYVGGKLFYKQLPLPVYITELTLADYRLCICSEKEIENVEIIPFTKSF